MYETGHSRLDNLQASSLLKKVPLSAQVSVHCGEANQEVSESRHQTAVL
jgi:hypothetical protein